MYYADHFVIQWDRVQSLDDVKRLFAAMQFSFEPNCPTLETIRDLVEIKPKSPAYFL